MPIQLDEYVEPFVRLTVGTTHCPVMALYVLVSTA